MKLHDFKKTLNEDLKDPNFAVSYLADAVDANDLEGFLLAVRDIIDVRGGLGKFAREANNLHRVSLYKALSEKGNPLFSTMVDILNSLGIGLRPYLKEDKGPRRKSA